MGYAFYKRDLAKNYNVKEDFSMRNRKKHGLLKGFAVAMGAM
ncbi:MAG: hypothetical protein UEA60_06300 [Lachnospiraceae bacterium]|nr:hypothetical protein [Lachnospiraceae bacterium]MEE0861683.1 hypothetical protein [Lachnospiraceae bacterium]